MRIAVGCDHRGLSLKQSVMETIADSGFSYEDFGCYTAEPVDYPDIALKVTGAVARGDFDYGVLICNTGVGMSIAANKVKGIIAALCRDAFTARRARQHNDANVLCLATIDGADVTCEILKVFFSADFEGGRHARRLDKVRAIEAR